MSDLESKRVKCYFLFNFEQARDFAEEYALYEGAWYRTVLFYTTIYGLPDAIAWNTVPIIRDEIVAKYDLELLKKDRNEEYWRFK